MCPNPTMPWAYMATRVRSDDVIIKPPPKLGLTRTSGHSHGCQAPVRRRGSGHLLYQSTDPPVQQFAKCAHIGHLAHSPALRRNGCGTIASTHRHYFVAF